MQPEESSATRSLPTLVSSFLSFANILRSIESMAPSLLDKVLKVAKEQGFCLPGNKVMIFTCDNEGAIDETVSFRMIEIDETE